MAQALALNSEICEICPPDFEAEYFDVPEVDAEQYEPLPYQDKFHSLTEKVKAFIAGIGTGKTTTGAMESFLQAACANPEPHLGLVAAPTFPMLRDSVIPAIQKVYPPAIYAGGRWDTAFSKSDMILRLVTGSKIIFRSLDKENYHRLRGIEIVWAWGDEMRLLTHSEPWEVMLGRMRALGRRRSAWLTSTPNGEDWLAEKFITKMLEGYAYVHATSYDNPHLPQDFFDRIHETYSEEYIDQELNGKIISMQGAVYKALKQEPWPLGNVLVYKPQKKVPVDLVIDFGYRSPAVLMVQPVRMGLPNGKVFALDVVIWELQSPKGGQPFNMKIQEVAEAVKKTGYKIARVFGDPAGDSTNAQTHISDARLLCKLLGGVQFIKPKKPYQRSKQNGELSVRNTIKPAKGPPKLVWAGTKLTDRLGRNYPLAPNSFKDHQNLKYPKHKPGQPQPQVSEKDGKTDHSTDALRYRQVMLYGMEERFYGHGSKPVFSKV